MADPIRTTCVIGGCGPAGAVLGLLLARAGIDVVVLEKHGDFLRDFRGDTIHASTLTLLDELGLGADFARLPHQRVDRLEVTHRRRRPHARRLRPAAGSAPGDRLPAAVGLPRLRHRARRRAAHLPAAAAGRGDRPVGRGRAGGRACRTGTTWVASTRSGPISPWPPTAAGRCCGRRPACGPGGTGPPMDVLWFRLSRREHRRGAHRRPAVRRPAADPDRPRRLLADRVRHPQGRVRAAPGPRPGRLPGRPGPAGAVPRRPGGRAARLGRRAACWTCRWTGCAAGTVRASSASATPRTRCRRSAGSASTSPCRTRSPPPTCSPIHCGAARCPNGTWPGCSGGGRRRRRSPSAGSARSRTAGSGRLLAGESGGGAPLALRLLDRFPVLQGVTAYLIGIGVRPEHVRPASRRRPRRWACDGREPDRGHPPAGTPRRPAAVVLSRRPRSASP